MAGESLVVENYREFLKATDRAERDTKKFVRDAFREVGDLVKDEAVRDLENFRHPVPVRTTSGLRTVVRQRGVDVEQVRRKTTGLRPDWGRTQMEKALIPALEANEKNIEPAMERAFDKVARHFNE